MDAHELVERFKSNPKTIESYEEITKWCGENVHNFDINNKEHNYLYEMSTRYLMKQKIGKFNQSDAKVLINYLAKKFAKRLGMEENVTVSILETDEYEKKYNNYSYAINQYIEQNGVSKVVYSEKVVDNLLSNNPEQVLLGIQTIYHEIMHTEQNNMMRRRDTDGQEMQYDARIYRMVIETVMREEYPKFYKENYGALLKENQAEYIGLKYAMSTMKSYSPECYALLDQKKCNQKIEHYMVSTFNNGDNLTFNGKQINGMQLLDIACTKHLKEHHDIIKKYPILEVAYHEDGTKKGIIELIEDRKAKIDGAASTTVIDELYATIANYRSLDKDELKLLEGYIEETGTEDEFVFNLIRYRLEHQTKMTQEQINEYMELERKTAANSREIQQEEKMWKNRFQSWEQESDKLPDGIKKKEDVIKEIQKLDRQVDTKKEKDEKTEDRATVL